MSAVGARSKPSGDDAPSSEARVSDHAPRRLPDGVLRAMRNARPGRPDTEEEKELFARRRLEEQVPSEVVSAEIAERWRRQHT